MMPRNGCVNKSAIHWLLAAIVCGGCSSSATELPVVSGTVTFQGAPVEGAMVVFHPPAGSEQQPAQAQTDAAGRFEMSTHVGQGEYQTGLAPGKYLVEIKKTELSGDFTRPPRHLLPEKYANVKTSGLSADVPPEGTEALAFVLE
jgi:hypothetical protein